MTPEQLELEREAFEEWYCSSISESIGLERYPNGCFCNPEAEDMYLAWCAAKSHAEKSEWISVEDKLPENSACYLGAHEVPFADGLGIGIYYFDAENKVFRMNPNGIIITIVTHWQPMPEPPKTA